MMMKMMMMMMMMKYLYNAKQIHTSSDGLLVLGHLPVPRDGRCGRPGELTTKGHRLALVNCYDLLETVLDMTW